MNSLKKIFIDFRTKSEIRKRANKSFTGFQDATRIGILFTVEDKEKHEAVKDLIKNLEKDKKKVSTLTFLPKGKDNYDFLFDYFSEKEFDFSGKIQSEVASNFIKEPFDFLFYIDLEPSLFTKYILSASKAKCRAGFYHEELESILEFMLKNEKGTEIKNIINNLYYYITLANSNNA